MKKYFILAILLLIPTFSGAEDKIFLKNGSVLVGKIVSMDEEQLVFKILDQEQHFQRNEIKKIQSEDDLAESTQKYNEGIWGLGLCAGISGGVGVQNALKFWNFQWDLSFLPTYTGGYFVGTQLKYNFLQRRNKRMLAYAGAAWDRSAADYSRECYGAGVGFSWSIEFITFTISGGVSNQNFLPLDFNFSIIHFF